MVSGLNTLPPIRVLVFAASMFGLIAALLDWALLRSPLLPKRTKPISVEARASGGQNAGATVSPPAPHIDPIVERARARPIVFREIYPPPAAAGLSFYGGVPVGPVNLAWPRKGPGDAPLSFLMQWDCTELTSQDPTGLLPKNGVLYLFAALDWSAFQFIHVPGPVADWQSLPVPSELPPLHGTDGSHLVPYCAPLIAPEHQDVPRLLPKWPFTPIAFSYPALPDDAGAARFWSESGEIAEVLLRVQHPEGIPPAKRRNQVFSFSRPFASFPHDYAAIRIVAARVLKQLRHPSQWLYREAPEQERQAKFQRWRDEPSQR